MEDQKPRKGLAALLIASKAPKMEMEDEDENEGGEGQDVACEDMMNALQDNDVEAFKTALNAFIDMR